MLPMKSAASEISCLGTVPTWPKGNGHFYLYQKADQALNLSQGRIHLPRQLANSSCLPLPQGYTSQQEFIATQGPLKKTIEDFWRLVWEQNVCNIIMLTVCMENGRVGWHHQASMCQAQPRLDLVV